MTEIYLKVKPGEDEFRIEFGDFPTVHLENEAESGRANTELLNRLRDILGEKPGIVSGHKSRRKKVKVDLGKDEVMERLEKHG